jgi:hypothetical protein
MTALVFGALLTTMTFSAALGQETLILQEGDVQRQFLASRGIEIPPATQEPLSNEELCRSLALGVFTARDTLHNAEMLEVADMIDQAAQLSFATQIYLDLGCSGERLLPQDVYTAGDDRPYYIGRRSR